MENPESGWNYEISLLEARDIDKQKQKEQKKTALERTPEGFDALNKKRVLAVEAPRFHGAAKLEEKELEMLVDKLRKSELDFSNFSSPENLLGLAIYLRGDGKTMTGEILEEVEQMHMDTKTIRNSVDRLVFEVSTGKRWDEILKVGQVQAFLTSPEGKLLIARADPNIPENQALADYNLAKARMHRNRGGKHGAVIADAYYEKLKGTPYEKMADEERRNMTDKVLSGSKDVANSLLSLDQLAIMATSGAVGKGIGQIASRSERVAIASNAALSAINESKVAKALLPGMEVITSQATDGKIRKGLKIAGNLTIDLGKFAAYEWLAQSTGNEDFAKTVAVLLVFFPGAKASFEAQMKLHPSAKVEDAMKYVEWLRREKGDDALKAELYKEIKRREIETGRWLSQGTKKPSSRDGKDSVLLANIDRMIQLSREVSEGMRIRKDRILERRYGNISPENRSTMDIYEKLTDFSKNTVKERKNPVTGATEKLTPEQYLPAFNEGLDRVGTIMNGVDNWVIMSSGTMYVSLPGYKTIPWDFDLVIQKQDFTKIYGKLEAMAKGGEIDHLAQYQIKGKDKADTARAITDPTEIQKLLEEGNLRIAFVFPTKNGVLMDVEMFAESEGKWLIQLGNMPRVIDTFTYNGKDIKTLGLFDLTEGYTINLMDEIGKNTVSKYGEKTKDATRVYNLTHYLKSVGITDPSQLIPKIDQVVASYEKYGGEKLAPNLKGIFEKKEQIKEELRGMIKDYKVLQKIKWVQEIRLSEFNEFLESWDKKKGELAKMYTALESWQVKPNEVEQIKTRLDNIRKEARKIKTSKLSPEQFAYFYEIAKVEKDFIAEIEKILKTKYTK